MQIEVDSYRCKFCGACQEIAPETFHVDDKSCQVTVNENGSSDPALIEQAAAWCPCNCIEIKMEDKKNTNIISDDYKKAVVLQRDKSSFALVPHFPLGVITPEQCRRLADVTEKYDAKVLKITSSMRLAMIGIKEDDVASAWEDLGMPPGAATGPCLRSVRACPGNEYCRLAKQDSMKIAGIIDERYHGIELPAKLKIAVSGCVNQCAENCIRDIGLYGKHDGWVVTVGGNGGSRPNLAVEFTSGLDDDQALDTVDRIISFYKENAKKIDRMSRVIKRLGFEKVKTEILT